MATPTRGILSRILHDDPRGLRVTQRQEYGMAKYVAALDQGTTSTRCMIFNHDGDVVGMDQKEHAQLYPQPGWVEHDPLEIWARTEEVVKGSLRLGQVDPVDLAAVGVTNQRETTLVWNRNTGTPYYNAIVWQDTRTAEFCRNLAKQGGQDRFRERAGLPLAPYFSGPKIRWILDNIPSAREDAERGIALFGTMDSWLIWWLTGGPQQGVHVSDVTNASRTMLMNLRTLDWDEEILEIMGIPHSMLPRIVASSDSRSWGTTVSDGPFGGSVPICGDLGDQQAALLGQACLDPGDGKNTYGTGCFLLLNTGTAPVVSRHGLLTSVAYKFDAQPATYCLEGSVAIAGALVQWLRDNLGFFDDSKDIETYAAQVKDNGGMYIVPAFSGLYAPHWRADARGVMVGLTRFINKNHICRAALEATAYQTLEVVEAMREDSGVELSTLKVDGGMVRNELLMQFQADILGRQVVRPKVAETTALGACYAAGLAVGFWDGVDDLRRIWRADKTWRPAMGASDRESLYSGWKKAVQRTLNWVHIEGDDIRA